MFFKNKKNKRDHIVDENGNLIKNYNRNSDNSQDPTLKYIKPKRNWRRIALVIGFAILAVIVWAGVGAFAALGKVITKNNTEGSPFLATPEAEVKPEQLAGEGDGRINILLIGIGGSDHPGGQLADSIEIISINPKDNTVAMLSVPRDLKVSIPGYGQGKINSAHSTGENNKDKEGGGPELLKKTVSEVFDIPIHYYVRFDFSGFVKLIDAIGGVDVNNSKAIYDPYYPDENMEGYSSFKLAEGEQHLDGKTALKYARSRETTSDFDRSKRQQQIIMAVKDKALSLGVLTNPKKINDIIQVIGDHLRTDLQLTEMQRLIEIMKGIDSSKINTKVLDTSADGPLTSSSSGGYYIIPRTGNFEQLREVIHQFFADSYLKEENAKIEVDNATNKSGTANNVAESLKAYGYNIIKTRVYDTKLEKTKIIDYSDNAKPFTLQFLKNRFNVEVEKQPKPSDTQADILIIIGNDYKN